MPPCALGLWADWATPYSIPFSMVDGVHTLRSFTRSLRVLAAFSRVLSFKCHLETGSASNVKGTRCNYKASSLLSCSGEKDSFHSMPSGKQKLNNNPPKCAMQRFVSFPNRTVCLFSGKCVELAPLVFSTTTSTSSLRPGKVSLISITSCTAKAAAKSQRGNEESARCTLGRQNR